MLEIIGLIALTIFGVAVIYMGGVIWFAGEFSRDLGLKCLGSALFLFGCFSIWLVGHLSPFGVVRVAA